MKIYTNDILTTAAAAIMLLTACTSDVATEQGSDSRVPIKLASNIAMTRGTQDTQLTSGENVYVWANVMQTNDNGSTWTTDWTLGAYIKAWRLTSDGGTGWSDISKVQYYPPCPLTMMATHGNFTGITDDVTSIPATITHNVATDQSLLADYAKSDLLYWASDNSGNGYTTSTPTVNMVFTHKLSKIEITLDATNSDYTADQLAQAVVRLNGILPTVTMNMTTTTSGDLSAASGTAQQIIPYSPSALHYEAIIPPQAKTVGVIAITLDGYTIPVTPAYPASSFEGNTRYQYTIALKNQEATVQSSISAWGYNVDGGNLATYQVANYDLRKLPLWYVAEKNVDYDFSAAEIANSNTFDGSGTFRFATVDDAGFFFNWPDAMKYFTTASNASAATATSITAYANGSGSKLKGWHLPINTEWRAIVPRTGDKNMFDYNTSGADGVYMSLDKDYVWGYNATTKAAINPDNCYWYRLDDGLNVKRMYALRFLGTEYCSVWEYELRNAGATAWSSSDYGRLTITARMIDDATLQTSANFTYEAQAEAICREYINKHSWASHFTGLTFTNGNDEAHGAVQRVFSAIGWVDYTICDHSTDTPTNNPGVSTSFYASTDNPENTSLAWRLYLDDDDAYLGSSNKRFSRPVRLFRDSYDYEAPKTTIAEATTSQLVVGDIVCSDGSIYAASQAAAVAAAHKTPVGIIAFVNDGTDIGNAATELGKGRYTTKSQGRALVLGLKNASIGLKWRTSETPFGQVYSYDGAYKDPDYSQFAIHYEGFERTRAMNNDEFPAAQSAYNYTGLTAPAYSTGWFMPSAGQWKKIVTGLTGFSGLNQDKWSTEISATYSRVYLTTRINNALSVTGTKDVEYTEFPSTETAESLVFWSITEKHVGGISILNCGSSTLGFRFGGGSMTTETYYTRPVFAF